MRVGVGVGVRFCSRSRLLQLRALDPERGDQARLGRRTAASRSRRDQPAAPAPAPARAPARAARLSGAVNWHRLARAAAGARTRTRSASSTSTASSARTALGGAQPRGACLRRGEVLAHQLVRGAQRSQRRLRLVQPLLGRRVLAQQRRVPAVDVAQLAPRGRLARDRPRRRAALRGGRPRRDAPRRRLAARRANERPCTGVGVGGAGGGGGVGSARCGGGGGGRGEQARLVQLFVAQRVAQQRRLLLKLCRLLLHLVLQSLLEASTCYSPKLVFCSLCSHCDLGVARWLLQLTEGGFRGAMQWRDAARDRQRGLHTFPPRARDLLANDNSGAKASGV